MKGFRADAVGVEARGEALGVLAVESVYDAGDGVGAGVCFAELGGAGRVVGAAVVDAADPGEEVGVRVCVIGFEADLVVQVGAGDWHDEQLQGARIEGEGFEDVGADGRGRRRGEAYDRDGGEGGFEVGEVGVGGTEVVPPFGDAVGFVDGDARELAVGVDAGKDFAEGA